MRFGAVGHGSKDQRLIANTWRWCFNCSYFWPITTGMSLTMEMTMPIACLRDTVSCAAGCSFSRIHNLHG